MDNPWQLNGIVQLLWLVWQIYDHTYWLPCMLLLSDQYNDITITIRIILVIYEKFLSAFCTFLSQTFKISMNIPFLSALYFETMVSIFVDYFFRIVHPFLIHFKFIFILSHLHIDIYFISDVPRFLHSESFFPFVPTSI